MATWLPKNVRTQQNNDKIACGNIHCATSSFIIIWFNAQCMNPTNLVYSENQMKDGFMWCGNPSSVFPDSSPTSFLHQAHDSHFPLVIHISYLRNMHVKPPHKNDCQMKELPLSTKGTANIFLNLPFVLCLRAQRSLWIYLFQWYVKAIWFT